jgi:hypothetical protein
MEVSKKIKGKKRKGREKAIHKKSQKWYISRIRGDGTPKVIV